MFKKKQKQREGTGFTLIELLIVIAIMSIIMMVTLANYNGMNKKIEVQNTAFDMALLIRETQVYGTNKKILGAEGFSDGEKNMFGLFLDKTNPGKYKVISFKDLDDDKKFNSDCNSSNPPNEKECQIISELPKGIHITEFYEGATSISDDNMLILFKRPNPDALIIKNGETNPELHSYDKICIEIKSKNEKYEAGINVGVAGNIFVTNSCQ